MKHQRANALSARILMNGVRSCDRWGGEEGELGHVRTEGRGEGIRTFLL